MHEQREAQVGEERLMEISIVHLVVAWYSQLVILVLHTFCQTEMPFTEKW